MWYEINCDKWRKSLIAIKVKQRVLSEVDNVHPITELWDQHKSITFERESSPFDEMGFEWSWLSITAEDYDA